MTFIDLFAGAGGFRRGMELAGHECKGFCEFDKFAVASYTAMHCMTDEERDYIAALPKNKRVAEAGKEGYRHGEWFADDIRRVRATDVPRVDCWCFGFPCQDISVAGKQRGLGGARSGLFYRVAQLLKDTEEENKPSYLFIENVKNLLSVNRGFDFLSVLTRLDELGYDCEWQVINSADYVPQNRERVFIVGHLRGRSTRQVFPLTGADGKNCNTIKQNGSYKSEKRKNSNVNRVYATDGIAPCLNTMGGGNREPEIGLPLFCDMGGNFNTTEEARCLQSRYYKGIPHRPWEMSGIAIPVLTPDRTEKRQNGRRFKENGDDSYTLTSADRHGVTLQPLKIREATKQGYALAEEGDSVNLSVPNSKTRRGRVGKSISNTLDCACNIGVVYSNKYKTDLMIRKLTPKECFRLQGWTDEYFDRAELVNSDSQLYKQAGNGVTVPVIKAIAERL